MIDHFDEQVKSWVLGVAEGAELWLGPPNGQRAGSGVGLYLLEVMKAAPTSSARRPAPLQLTLRYLITTWAEKAEDAHQLLVRLILAAMENADFEVESEPPSTNVWTAMSASPRPSFFLRVPFTYERQPVATKLVRQPLQIQVTPTVSFYGLLLGPEGIPLSDCRVEIPALNLSTSTDYKGRFGFPLVPGEGTKKLLIKAKGRELSISTDASYPDSAEPMVINFTSLEE